MKTILPICGLAIVHFLLSFFVSFAAGISGGAWRIASNILMFPLSVCPDRTPDLSPWLMWPLWIALSFVWASAIFYSFRALQK